MAQSNPLPDIPDLKDDDWVDLDELGGQALRTYIKYPGITVDEDVIGPRWIGCGALGETADYVTSRIDVTVSGGYTAARGMPVDISNALLRQLDQGIALFSYSSSKNSDPDNRGPESLRRLCRIGRPSVRLETLPVAQIKESHGLALDPDAVGAVGASAVVPSYAAMSVGDKVTFTWQGFFEGFPDTPISRTLELKAEHIGWPLTFTVPQDQVLFNDSADIGYSIQYADGTGERGESERQTLLIRKPAVARLPAPQILNHSDGPINPGLFPNGLILRIQPSYADIQQGDRVLVYGNANRADRSLLSALRVDRSILDRGLIESHIPQQWLLDNSNTRVTFTYQYARAGSALSSESLALDISKPLDLPAPIVEDAVADGDLRGSLPADVSGAYVNVPAQAEIGSGKVEMHWFGHAAGGRHIAPNPVGGAGRRFFIPATAIAANMSATQRFQVFYRVTPPGQTASEDSVAFNLRIVPLPASRYPDTQCTQAQGTSTLSLARVPAAGADLTVAQWPFMAAGQLLKIVARGVRASGGGSTSITVRNALPVTQAEFNSKRVTAVLARTFLASLRLNENFTLEASVSFDGGETYWPFKDGNLKLSA